MMDLKSDTGEKTTREKIGAYFAGAMETPKCPVCQSTKIRDSRSRLRDLPLFLVRAKPTRCMACYRRFYLWGWFKAA